MTIDRHVVASAFRTRFGREPQWVVRAPGRVNLIGEHTDYNDGFVLPLAIDRAIWIALEKADDRQVTVVSADFGEEAAFAIDGLQNQRAGWIEYFKGVAWSLQDAGFALDGWTGVAQGDVPLGAGLSSSAALEMAAARAFSAVGGFDWIPTRMALLGQRAENRWVGVNCGIMDQLISAAGKAGHALLIDCRSLELAPVPFPPGTAVVVLDTATRRGLVDSAYNERRSRCEAAARHFRVRALRDVDLAHFNARADDLDETTRRRAKHVITENQRTQEAAAAMRQADPATLGQLMNQSHASLRDDYEVSSAALDAMVTAAQAHAACYGARMTGAGFGGCAVALVEAQGADDFSRRVAADYERATGASPQVYVCQATDGAEAFSV